MKYLKEEIIMKVIDLANRCSQLRQEDDKGWINPFDEKEIEDAFTSRPEEERLEKFIDNLSDDEKTELMALMWLGRDGGEWAYLIDHAREELDGAAEYMAEKAPLAIYLKKGIERAKEMNLL